jgi:hypothetical protein
MLFHPTTFVYVSTRMRCAALTRSSQKDAAEGAFSLLYGEGNEHARDVRHTGPVKGANGNRLLDNGKGARYL